MVLATADFRYSLDVPYAPVFVHQAHYLIDAGPIFDTPSGRADSYRHVGSGEKPLVAFSCELFGPDSSKRFPGNKHPAKLVPSLYRVLNGDKPVRAHALTRANFGTKCGARRALAPLRIKALGASTERPWPGVMSKR